MSNSKEPAEGTGANEPGRDAETETAALVARMRETGEASVDISLDQYDDSVLHVTETSKTQGIVILGFGSGGDPRTWNVILSRKQRHQLAAVLLWDAEER